MDFEVIRRVAMTQNIIIQILQRKKNTEGFRSQWEAKTELKYWGMKETILEWRLTFIDCSLRNLLSIRLPDGNRSANCIAPSWPCGGSSGTCAANWSFCCCRLSIAKASSCAFFTASSSSLRFSSSASRLIRAFS